MPFPELIAVNCGECGGALLDVETNGLADELQPETQTIEGAVLFVSRRVAHRAASAAGWYIDARSEQCPGCRFGQVDDDPEAEETGEELDAGTAEILRAFYSEGE